MHILYGVGLVCVIFNNRDPSYSTISSPQVIICYFFMSLTMNIFYFFAIVYALAMTSTATAVLLGCAVEDPKMAQEFLPVLFVPQILFAGFFIPTDYIPAWLR